MKIDHVVAATLGCLFGIAVTIGATAYRQSREQEWLRYVELKDHVYQLDGRIDALSRAKWKETPHDPQK